MTSFNPTDMSLEDSILNNFGGPVINNLNHILGNLDDLSADTEIPSHATYIDTLSLECILPSAKEHFTVFSIHIQSINAKFDYLSALVNDLSGKGIGFSTSITISADLPISYCFHVKVGSAIGHQVATHVNPGL